MQKLVLPIRIQMNYMASHLLRATFSRFYRISNTPRYIKMNNCAKYHTIYSALNMKLRAQIDEHIKDHDRLIRAMRGESYFGQLVVDEVRDVCYASNPSADSTSIVQRPYHCMHCAHLFNATFNDAYIWNYIPSHMTSTNDSPLELMRAKGLISHYVAYEMLCQACASNLVPRQSYARDYLGTTCRRIPARNIPDRILYNIDDHLRVMDEGSYVCAIPIAYGNLARFVNACVVYEISARYYAFAASFPDASIFSDIAVAVSQLLQTYAAGSTRSIIHLSLARQLHLSNVFQYDFARDSLCTWISREKILRDFIFALSICESDCERKIMCASLYPPITYHPCRGVDEVGTLSIDLLRW